MIDGIKVLMKHKYNTIIKEANDLLLSQNKELEDTKEALRRCRNLLASEQELNKRLVQQIYDFKGK